MSRGRGRRSSPFQRALTISEKIKTLIFPEMEEDPAVASFWVGVDTGKRPSTHRPRSSRWRALQVLDRHRIAEEKPSAPHARKRGPAGISSTRVSRRIRTAGLHRQQNPLGSREHVRVHADRQGFIAGGCCGQSEAQPGVAMPPPAHRSWAALTRARSAMPRADGSTAWSSHASSAHRSWAATAQRQLPWRLPPPWESSGKRKGKERKRRKRKKGKQ